VEFPIPSWVVTIGIDGVWLVDETVSASFLSESFHFRYGTGIDLVWMVKRTAVEAQISSLAACLNSVVTCSHQPTLT